MNACVYIIDDSQMVRQSISLLLKSRLGVTVETFESGTAFVESKQTAAHCILLDLRMPGLSGWEVIEHLQRQGNSIPVLVMSGHLEERPLLEQPEFVRGFFQKPCDLMTLVQATSEAIASTNAAPE